MQTLAFVAVYLACVGICLGLQYVHMKRGFEAERGIDRAGSLSAAIFLLFLAFAVIGTLAMASIPRGVLEQMGTTPALIDRICAGWTLSVGYATWRLMKTLEDIFRVRVAEQWKARYHDLIAARYR